MLTEGKHAGHFLASEANGTLSRETGTVASGQNLVAGQVVMLSAGKLVAHDGEINTAGEVITAAEGILFDNVDATDGDVENCVYIKRLAEVKDDAITYPTESTAGGEKAGVQASLAVNHIVAR